VLSRLNTIRALACVTVVLTSAVAPPAHAQQFSADVVQIPARGTETSRIYVSGSRLRVQTSEAGQPRSSVIYDPTQGTMIIVNDQNHTYMGGTNSPLVRAVANQTGTGGFSRLFHPTNGSNPCADWNALVQTYARLDTTRTPPHFSCQSAGSDAVNGRPAHKWRVTGVDNGTTKVGHVWIDDQLHVVTRSQDETGTMELRNVNTGPLPASTFEVPAGYRKLDLSAMLGPLGNAHLDSTTIAGLLGNAARSLGNEAATSTTDAAKQKAKNEMTKKIHKLFGLP